MPNECETDGLLFDSDELLIGSGEPAPVSVALGRVLASAHVQGLELVSELGGHWPDPAAAPSVAQALTHLGLRRFGEAISWVLGSLSDREARLVSERVLPLRPRAGAEVGYELGVSRQRVSQLEAKAAAKWWPRVEDEATLRLYGEAADALLPPVVRHATVAAMAERLAGGEAGGDAAAGVLLRFSQRVIEGEWVLHPEMLERWQDLPGRLREGLTAGHLDLGQAELAELTDGLFATAEDRDHRLAELGAEHFMGRVLPAPNNRTRALVALRLSAKPMTAQELAELAGASPNYVTNVLAEAPDVVRADKERWDYADRVEWPYEGIVEAILDRIEEAGGAVPLATLMRELPPRFKVAETSVRAYATGHLFETDAAGFVRRAAQYRFVAKSPTPGPTVREFDQGWGEQVVVKSEHLRGYSMSLSPHVAYANGLRPGNSLRLPLRDSTTEVSVIWRLTGVADRLEIGRARSYLEAHDLTAGTAIWLIPTCEAVVLLRADETSDLVQQAALSAGDQLVPDAEPDDADEENALLVRLRRRRS